MNIELLKQIKEAILAESEKFDMWSFDPSLSCGTVGCIAGFACYLQPIKRNWNVPDEAKMLLDLTTKEAESLFYGYRPSGLPFLPLRNETFYDTPEHAKAAADFIDIWIAHALTTPKEK